MKFIKLFLLLFFYSSFIQSQSQTDFEIVKKRVKENYFTEPKAAQKDVLLLKKLAKTNIEKNTAYQYLGYVHNFLGNSDSTRFYIQTRLNFAKKHFKKSSEYYQAIIDYSNQGMEIIDSYVLIKELTEGLSDINEQKFSKEKGLMFMLLGDILLRDGEVDKANYYFDKSFGLINGELVKVDYYLRKSSICIKKQKFKESKDHLLNALNYANKKNSYAYPLILNKLGYTYVMLKDAKEAKETLNESLYFQNKNGFNNLTSETYLNLYYLAKLQNNLNLEKEFLTKALRTNENDIYLKKNIYLGFKTFYSKLGDLENENNYLIKFNKLNDSILNLERGKLKTDIESRFQLKESIKELSHKEKIIKKDARIKVLYGIGIGLLFLLILIILFIYFYKIRVQKKLRKSQIKLHEEQLKLMQEDQRKEIIKEKFNERKKLSMELHDGIANEIGSLKLNISNDSNFNNENINSILSKIDKLYNDVRNFSHELDPENITEVEFSQLVNNLCLLIEKKGIKTQKKILITKDIDNLEEPVLINLYRILQEIINNIIKHAKATEVQLEIYEDENELIFFVKDNGVGLINQTIEKAGIGLKNIKKRVEHLRGTYEFINLEKGTSVLIKIPKK
jgi:signal transduction histidine kinase